MRPFIVASAIIAGLGISACTGTTLGGATSAIAHAVVRDTAGHDLGVIALTESDGRIRARGALVNLPSGTHAIHLHAVGSCVAPFTSAGGHWNPGMKQHGTENPNGPHAGDLPNITAGSDGVATVDVTGPAGTIATLLDADGAAIVVHAAADDYRSDPAGNAGARIACGVITAG